MHPNVAREVLRPPSGEAIGPMSPQHLLTKSLRDLDANPRPVDVAQLRPDTAFVGADSIPIAIHERANVFRLHAPTIRPIETGDNRLDASSRLLVGSHHDRTATGRLCERDLPMVR